MSPLRSAAALVALAILIGCSSPDEERVVRMGFYAYFEPVSSSEDRDPEAPGFTTHRGYEADLLTAIEAMSGIGLRFDRTPIPDWPGIWLKPASDQFDMVGGGITILETRTRNAMGEPVVVFTDGHIDFGHSLLVRAEDAARLTDYDALSGTDLVGAHSGTTGEFRLLQVIGVIDEEGGLRAGVEIETPDRTITVETDGDLVINAGSVSAELEDRIHLTPADPSRPQVVYESSFAETVPGEAVLVTALVEGRIDALMGEISDNQSLVSSGEGVLAITVMDDLTERGGFAVDIDDLELLDAVNRAVEWLTDDGRIGLSDWLADPNLFMQRAELWNETVA